MTKYTLPDLAYDYGALEPHISAKIVELHHSKHHNAYVTNANATMEKLADAREKNDFGSIAALEKALAFNLSGHMMHSLYWQNMKPQGGGEPTGELAEQLKKDFGGFDKFKAQLTKASATVMGSGWGALTWDPLSQRLLTMQIHDHQSETAVAGVPVMVIDAWEHAFYLQYGPAKADYFEAIWNLWNWDDISARFSAAKKLDLGLKNVAS